MSHSLLDLSRLTSKAGDYATGGPDALLDPSLLQATRMRRRQLGRLMIACDPESASRRLPAAEYLVTRKVDGEFTCLFYRDGDVMTLNPGGTVRWGAPFLAEAAAALKAAGIKQAMLGGELYVRRDDDRRPRVHDVVRVARAPKSADDVARLCFAVFNLYDLDGEDPSMQYGQAMARVQDIFANSDRIHAVEQTDAANFKDITKVYKSWVEQEDAEGLVVRSDSVGVFKIKPRHTLDLAVIGYTEGIDDRAGMLHSLLMAVVRSDGAYQIVGRCGGGFSDEQREQMVAQLSQRIAESDYIEVNSDRVAYRMLEPGLVIEISCLDVISRTSHGGTIDRMVLEWNEDDKSWEGVRRLPLASIISPQFIRVRDDKQADADDVRLSQLADITEIPQLDRTAEEVKLPASTVLRRKVATKELRGATMVRKLLLWKTNKEEVSRDHPAFVIHLTDYSPNRKNPLEHDIRVSDSQAQVETLWEQWESKNFVKGWKPVE